MDKRFSKEDTRKMAYEFYQLDFMRKKLLDGDRRWSLHSIVTDVIATADHHPFFMEYSDWVKESIIKPDFRSFDEFATHEYLDRKYMAHLIGVYPELYLSYLDELTDLDLGNETLS